jgi:two-component system response regulator PilR (NtrC family)
MTGKRALIVDDEPDIRELLEITLGRMDIDTSAAPDIKTARSLLASETFDLCLTDLHLPDGDGLELVNLIAAESPGLPVAVITAFGSMDTAITALKAGAFDFVQKPVDLDQLRALVDTALRITPITEGGNDGSTRLTGTSDTMQRLRSQVAKLARSQAPIYVSGESGSGKEVAARLIHELGPRAQAPFIPVNCGAIPGELMESEFFGHIKGSFTGAVADKQGLFEAADGGTLFLDEVADLPLSMQVKLLRAIQEKAIRPVGSAQERGIDVRILSATHRDLARQVTDGKFRQDLYYRLNVIELTMPSLRERTEDIPELAGQILDRLAADYGAEKPTISESAMTLLAEYDFPGNVRELENVLERAFTLCENTLIGPLDLQLGSTLMDSEEGCPQADPASAIEQVAGNGETPMVSRSATGAAAMTIKGIMLQVGQSLEEYLEEIERKLITDALEATRWNKTAAAKQLGITFRALRYRLKKLELE